MIGLGIGIASMQRRRAGFAAVLFDRGPTVDEDGVHGGAGVPEFSDPLPDTVLFDFSTTINRSGFHGGTGVTET